MNATVKLDESTMDNVMALLSDVPRGMETVMKRATRRAADHCVSKTKKDVSTTLAMKPVDGLSEQKIIARDLRRNVVGGWMSAEQIDILPGKRLGLRYFGAKQGATGVAYKIENDKPGFVASAFQGPKPGVIRAKWKGNAFRRVGRDRLPIIKLHGPSPWGVFVKHDMLKPVASSVGDILMKRIVHETNHLLRERGGYRGSPD